MENGEKYPLVREAAAVAFDYSLVASDSIDFVDRAAVARSLDVPAITSHRALPKDVQIRFVREPGTYTTIRLLWGPFAFEDSNRPKGNDSYVTSL